MQERKKGREEKREIKDRRRISTAGRRNSDRLKRRISTDRRRISTEGKSRSRDMLRSREILLQVVGMNNL